MTNEFKAAPLVWQQGAARITVGAALDAIRSAGANAKLDVYQDAAGNVGVHWRGAAVPPLPELQGELLAFIEAGHARPAAQGNPWSAVYTGVGLDDDVFTLTRDEFTRFSHGFGMAVVDAAARPKDETPDQRRIRLRARIAKLKSAGVRDYSAQVAREEGIATGRLRSIVAVPKAALVTARQGASPFDMLNGRKR